MGSGTSRYLFQRWRPSRGTRVAVLSDAQLTLVLLHGSPPSSFALLACFFKPLACLFSVGCVGVIHPSLPFPPTSTPSTLAPFSFPTLSLSPSILSLLFRYLSMPLFPFSFFLSFPFVSPPSCSLSHSHFVPCPCLVTHKTLGCPLASKYGRDSVWHLHLVTPYQRHFMTSSNTSVLSFGGLTVNRTQENLLSISHVALPLSRSP